MPRRKRCESEEQRIDDERGHEDQEHEDRQQRDPEPDPPAARAPAQDRVEQPDEGNRDDEADRETLRPIPEPGAPTLHRLGVGERKPVPVKPRRKLEHCLCHQQQRCEHGRLPEAAPRGALGAVPETGAEPSGDQGDEHEDAPGKGRKVQRVPGARVGDRPLALLGRKNEGGGRAGARSHRGRRGRGRRGRRLRAERCGEKPSRERRNENTGTHRGIVSRRSGAQAAIVPSRSR